MEKTKQVLVAIYPYWEKKTGAEKFGNWGVKLWSHLKNRDSFLFNDRPPLVIERLFESQGYNLADLKDDEKVKNSKFLKSFVYEIRPEKRLFLYLAGAIDEKIFDMFFEKGYIEKPADKKANEEGFLVFKANQNLIIGIEDIIAGSGSLGGIELEKDWIVPAESAIIQTLPNSNFYWPPLNEDDLDQLEEEDFEFGKIKYLNGIL